MKKILVLSLIILGVMLVMPLAVAERNEPILSVGTTVNGEKAENNAREDIFLMLDTETDKVTKLTADEYIFGVVAAEIPALYETEALKAQAVAAYTFAVYKRNANIDNSYHITNDFTKDQSCISREKAREKWGDKADEYAEKIDNAVKEVKGLILSFESKPILAVYHAISAGETNTCEDIWGKALPYLQSVSSPYDKLSPNFTTVTKLSESDFKAKLSLKDEKITVEKIKKTASGAVLSVDICDKSFKGSELRSALDLKSLSFDLKVEDGGITVSSYGYGHGVGMSQYGADCMAKQGSDFREILNHYYTDCEIVPFKAG